MLLIVGCARDYTRLRFTFVALGFLFTFLGFVIYAAVDVHTQLHVAYCKSRNHRQFDYQADSVV